MSKSLIELHSKLVYLRDYLSKIGPERRKKDIAYKKLEEASDYYATLGGIVTQLNKEFEEKPPSSEEYQSCKSLVGQVTEVYNSIKLLLSQVDSEAQTNPEYEIIIPKNLEKAAKMAAPFDIKTAISLLPIMNGQEQVTKQLIDGILLYSSLVTDETQSQLIDFVLKTRLSANAKLRLKSTYATVKKLVEDIRKFLLPKKSTEALQTQLFRARQGRRSIEAFGTELEDLFVNLTIAQADEDTSKFDILRPLNEKTAIKRFADGLSDPRLSTIIASRQFSSLPEAIRSAIDESIMTTQQSEQVMQFRPTTSYNRSSRGSYHRNSGSRRGNSYKRGSDARPKNYNYQGDSNHSTFPVAKGSNRGHRTSFVNSNYKGNSQSQSSPRQQFRGGRRENFPRVQHTTPEADTPEESLRNQFFRA
ncbi:hypothetical protein NE865_14513 [Phthorimaea operculella]|nr:hypothetical protein NE865_14513 [Phthorimaea operculella]